MTKSMFVGHKDGTVSWLQMLFTIIPRYACPWELYSALRNTRNSLRASPTFQMSIHANKTTNLWSQQHSFSWSDIVVDIVAIYITAKTLG